MIVADSSQNGVPNQTRSQFHNHAQYVQAFINDRNISTIIHFKQYVHSFIQSAMFRGCMARQTNRLYVLRMIVKLVYKSLTLIKSFRRHLSYLVGVVYSQFK